MIIVDSTVHDIDVARFMFDEEVAAVTVLKPRVSSKAKAGFKLWAVGAGAEAGLSRGRTHRVSFTLTPKSVRGGDLLVSGSTRCPDGPGDVSGRIPD